MKIFNVMEDLVMETVNEIFEERGSSGFPLADCEQCRLDVACFALNRLQPEYLISGRGVVHVENELRENFQKRADIVALVNEGIGTISRTRRPYYNDPGSQQSDSTQPEKGAYFNFPAILGTILNGKTFEPVENINVVLLKGENPVEMMDRSWQNPYFIVRSTRGSFSFWPKPVKAARRGEKRTFCYEIRAELEGFKTIKHFIEFSLQAEDAYTNTFSMEHAQKIGNLHLFDLASEEERREMGVEDF